jgi:hypothetical protein
MIFLVSEFRMAMLKPQDIFVLLKIVALHGNDWSYPRLARILFMSPSEVHASIQRCHESRLFDLRKRLARSEPLLEFLIHGVPYAYPVHRGSLTRGLPTSFAAPPLSSMVEHQLAVPPVWPFAEGCITGYEVTPLHKSAAKAALLDSNFYELLSLVDALREGRARERQFARKELESRMAA